MATTVAVGSVSVTTSGTLTNILLQQISQLTNGVTTQNPTVSAVAGTPAAPVSLPAPTSAGTNVLSIPSTASGVISIPSGYSVVLYNGSGLLEGGDSTTAVIGTGGPLYYSGGAGTVIANVASGGPTTTGIVSDSLAGAHIAIANGGENVIGGGAGQSYAFDSGSSTLSGAGANDAASIDGTASLLAFMSGASSFWQQTGGSATVVAGPGGNSYDQTAGNLMYVAGSGGDMVSLGGSGSNDLILAGSTVNAATITGGAGSDTIIAGSAVYHGNSASTSSSFMVAGSGTSTVYTAANETMFGGAGNSWVSVASGSNLLFLSHGAADTITGGGGNAKATIWGTTNESLTASASLGSAVYIVNGGNSAINLQNGNGGSILLALDGGVFAGNATLTMSNAGNDQLVMYSADQYNLAHVNHTLTIANWQSTDVLDLVGSGGAGYNSTVVAAAQTALTSGNSFTLPDGTTVNFTNSKPIGIVSS